jgi:hypothetical protein
MNKYKNIQTKENYLSLLNSGMFFEFHPELSGWWDADKSIILGDIDEDCKVIDDFDEDYESSQTFEDGLQDLSLDYNGEEFYTLLFVDGGEDDFGFSVGLTPTLPDSFVNFDWDNAPDLLVADWLDQDYYNQFPEKEI